MLNFRRSLVAATIVFVLLSSAFVLPENVPARTRCPIRIPDSLLTLFLKSDLVVRASLKGEKFLKTTREYEYGSYYDVEKNLQIAETFKGQKLNSAAYKTSEYKAKNPQTADEVSEENEYRLKVGDEALFFLVKDAESGYYELADYSSGAKRLDKADLAVYEKRINELELILGKKKDQYERLAEWLVRLVEEPATRTEGVNDLVESFAASEDEPEAEEGEKVEENVEENINTEIKKPVAIDKNFRAANAPEIARSLTDSQKARISNAFFVSLSADLARLNSAEAEEEISPDYGLISLVGRWDKQNFAMNLFANLQNTGAANNRKILYLMNAVASFLEDENLYHIVSEYESAVSEDENAKTEYTEKDVIISDSEDEAVVSDSETEAKTSAGAENENSAETQKTEVVSAETQTRVEDETAQDESEKLTYKQYKAKLFESFIAQYGKVISQAVAAK